MHIKELTKQEFYDAPQVIQDIYLLHCKCEGIDYAVYRTTLDKFPEYFSSKSSFTGLPKQNNIPISFKSAFLKAQSNLAKEMYNDTENAEEILNIWPEFLVRRNILFNAFYEPLLRTH